MLALFNTSAFAIQLPAGAKSKSKRVPRKTRTTTANMSDDLDDQLMALVGGDEDSDEGSDQEMNISRSGSEESPESKSKKAAPAKKAKKRKQDYSDEEEGEA